MAEILLSITVIVMSGAMSLGAFLASEWAEEEL